MSRGQAPPRRAQPEDVGTETLPTSAAMPQPAPRPSGRTLTHPLLSNDTSVVTLTNNSSNIIYYNTDDINSSSTSRTSTSFLNRFVSADLTNSVSTTEDYSKLKEQFYQSYNPQIGLHTAAVLGGILGWLIVYLLYKTKVKKWVVGFVRNKYRKRKERLQGKKACEGLAECQDSDLTSGHPPDLQQHPYVNNNHVQRQPQQGQCWPPDHAHSQQPDPNIPQQGYPPQGPPQGYSCSQQPETSFGEENSPFQPHCASALLPDSQQMRGQQQCTMPSIVVESYSSLPHGASAPSPHEVQIPGWPQELQAEVKPQAGRDRRKNGRGEKGQQHQQHQQQQGGGKVMREKRKRYRRKRSRSAGRKYPEVTVLDVDEPDTKSLLLPPCTQADTAKATARWVQTMPLLMQSCQDVTGLILKIQPNMVGSQKQQSCPLISAALQYAALPLLGLPNVGWNKSMPHLADSNGRGSLKDDLDLVFSNDTKGLGLNNKDLKVSQPLASSATLPRPQSSQSCRLEISTLRPPPPPKSPPCLTIPIPDSTHLHFSPSPANLAIPACGALSSFSAPTSPVPIPVTPTVTIQNCTSRVSRSHPHPLRRHDSRDSASSSSSLDPLLQLQHDCDCLPSQQQQEPLHHQPVVKASPRSSWTVFDDADEDSCSGGVGGGCSSRQNSYRSHCSPVSTRRVCGSGAQGKGRSGPHDAVFTLETKL